jgi:TPR repeat protein
MNCVFKSALAAIILLRLAAPVAAGAFDTADATDAYRKGDYVTAFRLTRPLANQGRASAQHNLGLMYQLGRGVPQDYAEAMKWYRLAADQGHAGAQFNLGVMYGRGHGVPKDAVSAYIWFNLAAAQGGQGAVVNRDLAARRMTREELAEAQKRAREWKPKSTPP